MLRLFLLLGLAVRIAAQLVVEPIPDDIQAFLDEFKDERATANLAEAPDPGLQQPTLCDPNVKQHSGLLDAGNGTKYFFWFFESRSKPTTDPLVIWLTGGPGCSSQLALLSENGPCVVNKDGKTTELNPHSWNSKANVLWLDQPQSTGFSTGNVEIQENEDETVEHFYTFLMNFYKALPQYKRNDLYISGESYGGHWVPSVAHRVLQGGLENAPLKGILVGNGLTDPEEQYNWYWKMAKDGGKSEGGTLEKSPVGMLAVATMRLGHGACVNAIAKCNDPNSSSAAACTSAFTKCAYSTNVPYQLTGYNPYDMRIKCEKPPLCYDFSEVDTFLNTPEVQKAIGATKKWTSCDMLVNKAFSTDFMKNYHTKIPDLLKSGVRTLIYAGDVDFICNWLGNKHWTLKLDWDHKDAFNAAAEKPYAGGDDNSEVGKLREANGFAFFQVYQAGHMVPKDQPSAGLSMLNDFLSSKIAGNTEERVVI